MSNNGVSTSAWLPAIKLAAMSITAGVATLLAIYSVWFFQIHPEFRDYDHRDVQTAVIKGTAFQSIVSGGSVVERGAIVVTGFEGDRAILATQARFLAEDFPFIKVHMQGLTRFTTAHILWRRSDEPKRMYSLPLNRSQDGVTQVAMVFAGSSYKGEIEELAIGFFDGAAKGVSDNNGSDLRVLSVELRSFSWQRIAQQVFEDWTHAALWPGYANNVVIGNPANGMLLPNVAFNALAVISMLVALGLKRANPFKASLHAPLGVTILLIVAFTWMIGDALRWPLRAEQVIDARDRYQGLTLLERGRNNPHRCGRLNSCYEQLAPYF